MLHHVLCINNHTIFKITTEQQINSINYVPHVLTCKRVQCSSLNTCVMHVEVHIVLELSNIFLSYSYHSQFVIFLDCALHGESEVVFPALNGTGKRYPALNSDVSQARMRSMSPISIYPTSYIITHISSMHAHRGCRELRAEVEGSQALSCSSNRLLRM